MGTQACDGCRARAEKEQKSGNYDDSNQPDQSMRQIMQLPDLMTNTSSSHRNIGPAWLVVIALACGCKSAGLTHYVSPRVEGRVIDSNSHLPVQDVMVRRLASDESYRTVAPSNAGPSTENAAAVRTGSDGKFAFGSKRNSFSRRLIGCTQLCHPMPWRESRPFPSMWLWARTGSRLSSLKLIRR